MKLSGESLFSPGSSRCSRSPRGLPKAPLSRSTRPRDNKASNSNSGRVYGVVGVVALSCYLNGLTGEFVHDDIPAVTQNKDVLGLSPLSHVFRNDFWGTAMSDVNSHKSYRPLTTLTFRANYQVSGLQPLWFHVCNVLLHAAASLLFTRVCLAVAGLQPNFAGAAGILFAAHPIHTEAVTGIVGRADVLACVFFLLSVLVYHGTVVEVRWNEESVHFFRRAAKVLMSLSLLLVIRLTLHQGSLPKFSNQDNPAAFHPCQHVRFLTFCYLAAFNCWLLLCPATLSHDWQMGSVPLLTSLSDSRNIATCLFFGCCFLVAYRGIADFEQQKHPPLLLGTLFLVLPFLPAANLVVTVGFVVAERVLYIPSLGMVLLLVYGAQLLWGVFLRQRSLLLCAGILLLLVFCGRTVARNRDWASRQALIRAGLKALPRNAKLHYNFANFLRDTGQLDLATRHYREALRLWPTYASAHNNLGTLMSGTDEAESHFLAAIRYSPNHVNAHYNLGQVYRKVNRSEEAARMLERCVRLDAAYTPAYLLLARLYQGQEGRGPAVGRLLRHVARLQPNSPDHLAELAAWLHEQGYNLEAFFYYNKALRINPTHTEALLGAAKLLRAKGQYARIHQFKYRVHSSRNRNTNLPVGVITIHTENNYYNSLNMEVTSRQEDKLCPNSKDDLQEVSVNAEDVPSMADHREQGSNKSRQTRCGTAAGNNRSRGRRSSPRNSRPQTATRNIKVEPPSLLVQNLLETLK
ncbi:protein O-mannosyl-transferase TMTC1 isoform X2 [Cryptotermes secundus]|uniref:protein O-mannosyl-transferase TMTC1 isoform X2 n=1 Tax=Cryptotermes secundus TaxID=105785 RepID=UPI001454D956|nr:protein O-mannosyl-transferase TMTC1 isoform X2 [Cryptotermes secundus]